MIDWYAEAKRREQERLQEAQDWHLRKSLQSCQATGLTPLTGRFLAWLGAHLVASGTRLQTQYK